ncbi:MAG TPA: AraC family transcriptional regulator [Coxiellaceae bacterium]|nr:AraC family transcriptional regulator [Coxiellaceae bacterium]
MLKKCLSDDVMNFLGLSMRTSNANNQSQQDIQALWARFFAEDIKSKIQNRLSDDVFMIYTDYEGDFTKPYICVLGCQVSSFDNAPSELRQLTVPAASYEVYQVDGDYPQSLIQAWQTIWQADLDRAYTADFERYPAAFDFKQGAFEIYIAVK